MQAKRVYGVYDKVLASDKRTWILGEEFTLADIIAFPWLATAPTAGAAQ